jgi:hypothetical protein
MGTTAATMGPNRYYGTFTQHDHWGSGNLVIFLSMDVVTPLTEVIGTQITLLAPAIHRKGKGVIRAGLIVLHRPISPDLIALINGGFLAVILVGPANGPGHTGFRQTRMSAYTGYRFITRNASIVSPTNSRKYTPQLKPMVVSILKIPDDIVPIGRCHSHQTYYKCQGYPTQFSTHDMPPSEKLINGFIYPGQQPKL